MSKLSELQGKPKVYKVGNIDLELKPLTVDELDLFNIDENAPIEKQMESTKGMITKVLKNSYPDATEDELKGISLEHLTDLMNAIMDLHKLGGKDSAEKRLINAIKAKQTQAKPTEQK